MFQSKIRISIITKSGDVQINVMQRLKFHNACRISF